MRSLMLILFLSSICSSSGPKYNQKDPLLNDEIANIYKDIGRIPQFPRPFTKAQLGAMTPRKAGEVYYCTDCTADGVVQSTGATLAGFSRITSKTTAIQ